MQKKKLIVTFFWCVTRRGECDFDQNHGSGIASLTSKGIKLYLALCLLPPAIAKTD